MGLKTRSVESLSESSGKVKLQERPLYFWLKSFASREIEDDAELSQFVKSNALNYALEYVGITPESEQSSLHLSAIFDEESSALRSKYPSHYESETKSRIQTLNRIYIELKSFFEDRYSQLVAIRPPNSVHITSACDKCAVEEFEKLLFLLLGAAIQGTQKQETIQTIKRFPSKIQESLIECVKLIADNPELLNVKSWNEFQTLKAEEQRKIYESLISLIRKLILERNEYAQNQLIADYFVGYTSCDMKRCYGGGSEGSDDSRLAASMRQLKEQLSEKSELLQECREELEKARNRILDLEIEVSEMQHKHRAMKKARDELDALRESQEKAVRLEAELLRLKSKLEESELVYDRVENLEIENRNWQVKHDMLLDQISFLSFEKSSRDTSFEQMSTYNGILEGIEENYKDLKEEDFASDNEEPSVKEKLEDKAETLPSDTSSNVLDAQTVPVSNEALNDTPEKEDKEGEVPELQDPMNTSTSTISPDSSTEKEEIFERPTTLDISQTESIEQGGHNLVASTPKGSAELISQEVQTPNLTPLRTKRPRRLALLNWTKNRRIIIPLHSKILEEGGDSSQLLKGFKLYNVTGLKGSARPKKFRLAKRTPDETLTKEGPPSLDNGGNEADEELSISPTGNSNLSDLDSNNDQSHGTDNDSDIYFVCSPQNSNGSNDSTPRRPGPGHFGTTTAFPVSKPGLRRTEFSFDPHNLSDMSYDPERHENHLTIYSQSPLPNRTTNGEEDPDDPAQPYTNGGRSYSHHNVQVGPSTSNSDQDQDDDASNAFTFGDYNIQLNLRNSIKPGTALINKISSLSSTLSPARPDRNFTNNNQYSPHSRGRESYAIETSSEEDGSIWYEYGCV